MLGTTGDGWNNQTKYQLYIYTIYRYTQLNFGTFECYIDNSHINAPWIYHSKMKVQTCFIIILIYILKSWNIQAWINQNFTCVVIKSRWYEGLTFKSKSIFNMHLTPSQYFFQPFLQITMEQFSLKIATLCLDNYYLHTFSWHGICSGGQALSSNKSAYRSTESSTCWTSMSYIALGPLF